MSIKRRSRSFTGAVFASGLWLAPALMILMSVSCSEESESPAKPEPASGVIEGKVLGPDGPIAAEIWVESVGRDWDFEDSRPETLVRSRTDPDGRYRVDVPAGQFRVGINDSLHDPTGSHMAADLYYTSNGMVGYWGFSDTVTVGVGTVVDSIDFSFGSLDLRLEVPIDWEGREVTATAALGWSSASWLDRFSATIRAASGRADVSLRIIPAGLYRIEVGSWYWDAESDTRINFRIWLPGVVDPLEADSITIEAGRTTTHQTTVSLAPVSLSGTIDGSWRSLGLDPPRIEFIAEDRHFGVYTEADETGDFLVSMPVARPGKILVRLHRSSRWIGGASFEEATLFDPPPGGRITGIRLTDSAIRIKLPELDPTARIRADLTLLDSSGHSDPIGWWQVEQGESIVISLLDPGTYRLHIAPDTFLEEEWLAQWYDQAPNEQAATPLTIASAGDFVTANVVLEPGGRIEGTVRDARGDGVPSARLFLTTVASAELIGYRVAAGAFGPDPTGSFAALGIPDGEYRIAASISGPTDNDIPPDAIWYPGTAAWDSASVLVIGDHSRITGIDFMLP